MSGKRLPVHLLFFFLALLGYCVSLLPGLSQESYFVFLSLLLVSYLAAEVWNLRRLRPDLWMANPVVLTSFFTFAVAFGATNFLFFLPDPQAQRLLGTLWPMDFGWANAAVTLALVGAFAMWRGYHSGLGPTTARTMRRFDLYQKILRREYAVRMPTILLMICVSMLCRFGQMMLGIYGYSSTAAGLSSAASYSQYLNMGESLGKLALLALALHYFFRAAGHRRVGILFFIVFFLETLFGVLSGMKLQVVFPFVTVLLVSFLAKNRLPRLLLAAAILSFVLSYQLVGSFRSARYNDPNFRNTSVTSIFQTALGLQAGDAASGTVKKVPVGLRIAARLNATAVASRAVEFRDQGRVISEDPKFLENLLLAPAYALIPRMLWPSKPYEDLGQWFNEIVLGHSFQSSVGMSPVGYLYFAGGVLVVLAAFFLVGVWQRLLYEEFLFAGSGSLIIFVGMLMPLVKMPHSFYALIVYVIRMVPLLLIAQFALFRK